MVTAIVSILTSVPVKRDVAMTGEITLRGKVLPIGGVRDKVLAAHRAGMKTVILPEQNRKDVEDVPEAVRKELKIVFAAHMDQVLDTALFKRRSYRKNTRSGDSPKASARTGVSRRPTVPVMGAN